MPASALFLEVGRYLPLARQARLRLATHCPAESWVTLETSYMGDRFEGWACPRAGTPTLRSRFFSASMTPSGLS